VLAPEPRAAAPPAANPPGTVVVESTPLNPPVRHPAQLPAERLAQPSEAPAPASTPAAAPQAPAQPAGAAERVAAQAPSLTHDPNKPVQVVIAAEEAVWVLARADGQYLFSGTLEPQQSRTVEADRAVLVRLGNAGGVSITLNGKPIGPVGPKGQV